MPDLTPRWTTIAHHDGQQAYRVSPHRFNVVPSARRSGKTEFGKRKLVRAALMGTSYARPRFVAAAPTHAQAKTIFWTDLKDLSPPAFVASIRESEPLSITFINGAVIEVRGMDRPERIEGSPLDGILLDEYANMKGTAWTAHILPALADRNGWADLVGVPEGRNHYYDLAMKAQARMLDQGKLSEWGYFHWTSAEILPLYGREAVLEQAREDMDELTFKQEFEGSFINFQGRAYYAYDPEKNLRKIDYNPNLDLIFCLDFNVEPGTAVVCQEQRLDDRNTTAIIGEVYIPRNSNTPAVCRKLIHDWQQHEGHIYVYGDATGGKRSTAGDDLGDWDIVDRDLRAHFGNRYHRRVPPRNPSVRARIAAVNSRCCTDDGHRHLYLDPSKAPKMQRDLEGVTLLEGGSGELDKKKQPDLTHLSDALGYYIVYQFPVRERQVETIDFAL